MSGFVFFVLMLVVIFSGVLDDGGSCNCRCEPREYTDAERRECLIAMP